MSHLAHRQAAPKTVHCYIFTISDTRTTDTDLGGRAIVDLLTDKGHDVVGKTIVPDDPERVREAVQAQLANDNVQAILTTGGTGISSRDQTYEAISSILEKRIDGFGELFRELSYKTIGTSAMQSRACAVLANGKYIFALPGSSGGVTDAWDGILKYQLDINHKPCNFVELFPRLKEK